MKRIDVTQGTDEWFEIKHGKIGGSRAEGLFTKGDNLLHELLSEKVEDFEIDFDSYSSPAMIRGIELEPVARQKISEYTGVQFNTVGWLQCEESELIGISPDGISDCGKYSCEIKCPGKKAHLKTILFDEIPQEYLPQCIQYFVVNPDLEVHYFGSFRPENKVKDLFVKAITRDTELDIGWTKKGKVKENRGKGEKEYVEVLPDIRTVSEWVKVAKSEVKILEQKIDDKLKQLSF